MRRSAGSQNSMRMFLLAAFAWLLPGHPLWAEQAAEGPTVSVRRPIHPILIRNDHAPALRVMLEVTSQTSEKLTELVFAFDGTDDLADIDSVRLFGTGSDETFSAAEPLSHPLAPRPTIAFPLDRELTSGKHVFWLATRLTDSANLDHCIVASCKAVVTSTRTVTPADDQTNPSQRIGVALRKHNDDGVHTYRIPALTTSTTGTLLAVYDRRRRMGRDLQEDIDIGLSRSTDGGQTWNSPQVIMDMGQYGGLPEEQNGCSDPGIIVDQQTGEIFCFAVWMHGKPGKHQWVEDGSEPGFEIGRAAQLLMVRSSDDGLTWSQPVNLTRQLKLEAWWLLAPSPQSGFCLADGTLVMPVQGRTGRAALETFATLMISRDHGQSWTIGKPAFSGGNECQAAQLSDGSIMLNMRNDHERYRAVAVTKDLGQTWTDHPTSRHTLIEPNCNGSLLSVPVAALERPLLLFANPHSQTARTHHTVQVSFDDGHTWPESHHWLLDEGRGAGYPSMTRIDDQHIGIVYEGSQAHLVFQKLPLSHLMDPAQRTGQAPRISAADYFHQQVEPLLRRHCYSCHSHSTGQMESNLALDWRSGWVMGGERGPAIVPGEPDRSLLIRAVGHLDTELKMPEKPLSAQEIEVLTTWVRQGAYDDRVVVPDAAHAEQWWSLKPLAQPTLPSTTFPSTTFPSTTLPSRDLPAASGVDLSSAATGNPIDAFIAEKLSEASLTASPVAHPRELMRRLYFDLLGLPPSPQEVASFESDPSETHYLHTVDRLLQSPRYGERWARHWMDTIHFADSHGYEHDVGRAHAWPYRDYLIAAFNEDVPWSTFIRQQLAVDYFQPEASHLLPALGFLGAGTFDYSTYQTGPVTFDYLDRDDMLTQTMSAFVSTTANCARCHAHKFDPIKQEDYYALQAVFAGIVKGDIPYDRDDEIGAERRRLNKLLEAAQRDQADVLLSTANRQLVAAWELERGTGAPWTALQMQSVLSIEGATLTTNGDGVIVASGMSPETDTYVLSATTSLQRITAVRLDLFPHESLPMKGPGRCHNGNLHLSEAMLMHFKPGDPTGHPVTIAHATADFNQAGWEVHRAVDKDAKTAWGIHPAVGQAHHAVFELTEPLDLPAGSILTITLKQLHGGTHLIGAFGLSVTDAPVEQARALPIELQAALEVAQGKRTTQMNMMLAKHVVTQSAQKQLNSLPPPASVYAAAPTAAIPLGSGNTKPATIASPKPVHLLKRGDINQPQAEIPPGALSALKHLPARFAGVSTPSNAVPSEAERRAALADWIAHPENVLTWRSVVNRVWHYHFGRGLCDTPSDLGRMGGVPSHPELIDWLAVWFRDEARGSLKQLHRLIVTSRTYRQSSVERPDASRIDGDNRWLWRQNRLRLDADAYRDFVLVAAGCMDLTMGGAAIEHFHQSPGAQLTPNLDYAAYDWASPGANRRSIYRFVWRGIPDPLMSALDFPDLGLLTPTRSQSISPLQALALLNNNFVLYHSQAMADSITAQSQELDQQIDVAVLRCYQRHVLPQERALYRDYVQQHGLAALCRLLINSSEFLFIP